MPFEKDDNPVEAYTSYERTFYIFSNVNTTVAIWADGNLRETITGDLSVDEVKKIINSIGGSQ